jgi:hypothetical protein
MSADPRILDHIQESVNALLDGSASGDLMFFAGVQQESIPTALFLDPTLRPVDRNLWVVMRLCMRSGGKRTAFPSYEDLENVWRVGSRDTLSISYALLRLRGWLTRVHAVRDAQGRHRGQIWMVHDEPAPLAELIEIDPDYMSFFDECRSHRSPRIRAAAVAMDASLSEAIERGEDITAHTAASTRRIGSLSARLGNEGDFFGVSLGVLDSIRKQAKADPADEEPGQKIGPGEIDRVRKSDSAEPGQKIGLGFDAEKSDLDSPGQKIGLGSNSLNDNGIAESAEFGTESALKSCSSSIYKSKTTTTTDAPEKASTHRVSALFPEALRAILPKNEQELIARYLTRAPEQYRQGILEYLTERMTAGQVQKPVPFAISLVKAAQDGLFYRHTAAAPPSTAFKPPPPPSTVARRRALVGEAEGLRRLMAGTADPAIRGRLAEQLSELETKIMEIKTGVVQ